MWGLAGTHDRFLVGEGLHFHALNPKDGHYRGLLMMIHNIIYLGITSKGMSYSLNTRSVMRGLLFSERQGIPFRVVHSP